MGWLPAYPTLIVTGALASRGGYSLPALLATAVAASLIADLAWYSTGRRIGGPVLRTLCRVSLSPDSCVRQTESIFTRWGAPSPLVTGTVLLAIAVGFGSQYIPPRVPQVVLASFSRLNLVAQAAVLALALMVTQALGP